MGIIEESNAMQAIQGMQKPMGPIEQLRNERNLLAARIAEIDTALKLADQHPEVCEILETIARISGGLRRY